jgi:hypothetical protein
MYVAYNIQWGKSSEKEIIFQEGLLKLAMEMEMEMEMESQEFYLYA